MSPPGKSIGILGGSFDPVHKGHISIAKSFLESDYIDELWVLLTPDPPHKTETSLADYRYRLKMLQAAFGDIEGVNVSDLENKLSQPSYTIQTLKYLYETYPQHKFFLCIGGDSFQDFKSWKDWQQILAHCNLLVAKRPGTNTKNMDDSILKNTYFINHHPIAVSSTEVRELVRTGNDISNLVPKEVEQIIETNNLYNSID
ncbi:nicotinate (nicotinamide) nucleotide adenylyltransferase [Fodinibius sp. Rm-B-1B1-1]|uniref:nicotinate (nicotinamide) nucleotide adenylyltransferase n=1 Tax=Fodinibius alkaliphilus TaxID=3140241 RepID=UPI00315A2F47